MIYKNKGNLKYLISEKIANCGGINHIFTTRHGGVSLGSLSSLNLGTGRQDDRANLLENYKRVCLAENMNYENTVLSKQTHSVNIRVVTEEDKGKGLINESDIRDTDGLVTNVKNLPLVIFYADCVPVLLYEPHKKVIAVLHAGWRGTVGNIAANGVSVMKENFGAKPENILAAIGPSIGICHFETGLEVAVEFEKAGLGECIKYNNGKANIDLWQANAILLQNAGVLKGNIDIAALCTVCGKQDFFSHRGCGADTGRMGLIASLI